jgi:hypothetical protein
MPVFQPDDQARPIPQFDVMTIQELTRVLDGGIVVGVSDDPGWGIDVAPGIQHINAIFPHCSALPTGRSAEKWRQSSILKRVLGGSTLVELVLTIILLYVFNPKSHSVTRAHS